MTASRPHRCPFCVCNFSNRMRFERHAARNHHRRDAYRSRRLIAWLTASMLAQTGLEEDT